MLKSKRGYTLVEVAITISIIGILIAIVLKGAELLENSAITTTISNIQSFQAATKTFKSQYKTLPGDSSKATIRLPGCNAANNCIDGDGNGVIYASGNAYRVTLTGGPTDTANEGNERWLFWKHLILAGYITGFDPADNGTEDGLPYADIGGVFSVGSSNGRANCGIGGNFDTGLWLAITKAPSRDCRAQDALPVKPVMIIDIKMDDGAPNSGVVRAGDYTAPTDCVATSGSEVYYDGASDTASCSLLYLLK